MKHREPHVPIVQGDRRPYGKLANKMTQIEHYKRYSEDECKKMSDEEYDKAAKYLQALSTIIKESLND